MKLTKNRILYLLIPLFMGFIGGIMSDYTGSGFDQFLQRPTSEVQKDIGVEGEKSEADTDSEIISLNASKISEGVSTSKNGKLTIDWNKGTIKLNDGSRDRVILGDDGTNNFGIRIFNKNGDEVISLADKEFIKLVDNFTIQDKSSQSIVSDTGIVSTSNFPYQETSFYASNIIVTSSTEIDLPQLLLVTPVFTKNTTVLLFISANMWVQSQASNDFAGTGFITLAVDGTTKGGTLSKKSEILTGEKVMIHTSTHSSFKFVTMGSGSHTIIVRARVSTDVGDPELVISGIKIAYLVLGS